MASSVAHRASTPARIEHLYQDPHDADPRFMLALRRYDRRDQPDPHRPGDAARRDLQSRRPEPCAGVASRRAEYTANADALGTLRLLEAIRHARLGEKTPLLPGLDFRALRQGPGRAAERDDAVLSALALCGGEALRLLDHGELSRGLRHARLERHPVQPRKPDPRRDVRHAQDHARGRRDPSRACRIGSISAISTPCATGATRATMCAACGGSLQQPQPDDYVLATGETHTVRSFVETAFARSRRRHRLARRRRRGRRASTPPTGACWSRSTRATSVRPRSIC